MYIKKRLLVKFSNFKTISFSKYQILNHKLTVNSEFLNQYRVLLKHILWILFFKPTDRQNDENLHQFQFTKYKIIIIIYKFIENKFNNHTLFNN
jgi:hypothetical protein